jgi:hypothetical protein
MARAGLNWPENDLYEHIMAKYSGLQAKQRAARDINLYQ